jgi:hypothetical protein
MNIYNMTPHPVNIVDENGNITTIIMQCGWEVRLSTSTEVVDEVDGIPITKTVFGEPVTVKGKSFNDQPNPWDNINMSKDRFIVSQLVKTAFIGNLLYECMLVPAEVVRDANGNIIGCKSLGV